MAEFKEYYEDLSVRYQGAKILLRNINNRMKNIVNKKDYDVEELNKYIALSKEIYWTINYLEKRLKNFIH